MCIYCDGTCVIFKFTYIVCDSVCWHFKIQMYEFPGNSVGRKLILRMEIKQNNMCFSEIICVLLFLQKWIGW